MSHYPEYELVQKCLLQIEKKLGWGSSDLWHNEVFIELSETMQQVTKVLLSPTTLKRVWGKVNYKNAPSISTLNTLSQFIGYTNWRDFKNKNEFQKPVRKVNKFAANRGLILTSAAFMTLLFISLFSMIGLKENRSAVSNYSNVKFSSHPITLGIPNSVVFDFELDQVKSDSIYIQQFWDPTKTIKINTEQQQATGIYYFPGYFRAKLLVDGQIIKEEDLFIKSPGWIGTIDYEPIPKYITNAELIHNGLSLPSAIVDEIKLNEAPLVSSFHLVDEFQDVSVDNFLMETSIRNVFKDKWAVCQTTRIVVLGATGAMIIPFSIPGCVSDIGLMLNDVYLDGKEHDLSAFGVDFSVYRNIEIKVKDKQVSVSVDQNEIYNGSYHESIGNFVGIRYRFLGAGEVSHLRIGNDKGQLIITEDFSISQ